MTATSLLSIRSTIVAVALFAIVLNTSLASPIVSKPSGATTNQAAPATHIEQAQQQEKRFEYQPFDKRFDYSFDKRFDFDAFYPQAAQQKRFDVDSFYPAQKRFDFEGISNYYPSPPMPTAKRFDYGFYNGYNMMGPRGYPMNVNLNHAGFL